MPIQLRYATNIIFVQGGYARSRPSTPSALNRREVIRKRRWDFNNFPAFHPSQVCTVHFYDRPYNDKNQEPITTIQTSQMPTPKRHCTLVYYRKIVIRGSKCLRVQYEDWNEKLLAGLLEGSLLRKLIM
jgi:hypothetical protein